MSDVQNSKHVSLSPKPNLKSLKRFAVDNPDFTEASLRWLIFNENTNGLKQHRAIIRFGRRVFIDEDRFFRCILAANDFD